MDRTGLQVDKNGRVSLDVYCDLLRKNDPRITKVHSKYYYVPDADYGDGHSYDSSDSFDESIGYADYNVEHDSADNPNDEKPYVRIGKAIKGNTNITCIVVNFCELYTCNDHIDKRYLCYEYLHSNMLNDLFAEGLDNATFLLHYIRTSSVLRRLQLSNDGTENLALVNGRLAGLFYEAIMENPHCRLDEMKIDRWESLHVPQDAFSRLLATRRLRRLSLRVGVEFTSEILKGANTSNYSAPWLQRALWGNKSLEHVALLPTDARSTRYQFDSVYHGIISHLGLHPCLRSLRIRVGDRTDSRAPVEALATLLRLTSSLETLDVSGVLFSIYGMQSFVNGLRSNHTLSKLILVEYKVPRNSIAFCEYLQTKQVQPSNLQELQYDGNIDSLAGAMVLEQNGNLNQQQNSIGSALQVLHLQSQNEDPLRSAGPHDIASFLHLYGAKASMIHLKMLSIERLCKKSCKALLQCAPHLVHLRSLKISCIKLEAQELTHQLVKAFKQNGSLHNVSVPATFHHEHRKYFMGRSRLRNYCARNQKIPMLLVLPQQSDQFCSISSTAEKWLTPTLFLAARQASRTAPNMMLLGLHCLADLAGPSQRAKRSSDRRGKKRRL
jgi:hypothetical protein